MFFRRNQQKPIENSKLTDLIIANRDLLDRIERLERGLRGIRMQISRLKGELPDDESAIDDGLQGLRKVDKSARIGL